MKNLNSYAYLAILFVLSASFLTNLNESKSTEKSFSSDIETYLEKVAFNQLDDQSVTVFSNFLIKDQGDFIKIDFMVEDNGEVTILNSEFEEEYYIFDKFSDQNLVKHAYPLASVKNLNLGV